MASTSKAPQDGGEFPTDWNIDKYKREYETEEHWTLRRRFMEAHKHKFPEQRLVCLAQVFTNVEFMGCKYPDATMRQVAELSQEVAKEFRAKRALRLKRTFVAASDAAESRAKSRREPQQPPQKRRAQFQQDGRYDHVPGGSRNDFPNKRARFESDGWQAPQPPQQMYQRHQQQQQQQRQPSYQQQQSFQQQQRQQPYHQQQQQRQQQGQTQPMIRAPRGDLFESLRFGKFVLFLTGGRNCLRNSAQRSQMQYLEKEVGDAAIKKKVEVYLNDKLVTSAMEDNVKASKSQAFTNALEVLQRNCYSIKPNPLRDTVKIDKSNNQVICGVVKQQTDTLEDKKLDANNKGYKMMKMMGWTGGGLGSNTQGRKEPVGYLLKNNRAGLGNAACKLDRKYFTQMLQNYIDSDDIRELQFESTFTKDERAMLHEIAGKFNLKSSSYGKADDRRLIICKKNITNDKILSEVLLRKNANFCDQYDVQVPEAKSKLYPEHTAKLQLDL